MASELENIFLFFTPQGSAQKSKKEIRDGIYPALFSEAKIEFQKL